MIFTVKPSTRLHQAADKRRKHDSIDVSIVDIRPNLSDFELDTHGFEVGPFTTSARNFDEPEAIKRDYYPDVCAHVQKVTGATSVIPVVHIARRKPWEEVAKAEETRDALAPVTAPAPNRSVHVDQSYTGAKWVRDNRLASLPEEEAEKLKKARFSIVNLWQVNCSQASDSR